MFSHILLFVVMLFVAKRLVEVIILIVQRLGRQNSADSGTMVNAGCAPKISDPKAVG